MKTGKKIIIGVLVLALVFGGIAGGAVYFRKNNQETVGVVSVDSLASPYYMDDTMLDGNVVANVTQNVNVDNDMIIQEVFVEKGAPVQKGDKLISFDMTLVQMELNIAKLQKQRQEQNLAKAVDRLNSLKNGGPIEDPDDTSLPGFDSIGTSGSSMDDSSGDELVSVGNGLNGNYLAAALNPVLAAAVVFEDGQGSADAAPSFGDGAPSGEGTETPGETTGETTGGEETPGETAGGEETPGGTGENPEIPEGPEGGTETPDTGTEGGGEQNGEPEVEFGDGSDTLTPTPQVSDPEAPEEVPPSETPDAEFSDDIADDVEIIDPEPNPNELDITDGTPTFYQKLEGDTEPFTGTGTEEDPFVFLCSSAKGSVIATGAFLNKMAGYLPDGTKEEGVDGYWYQLEFHQNDTITNFADRTESCTGYYLIDGSLLEAMVEETAEVEYTLDGAMRYEEDFEIPDGGWGMEEEPEAPTMSREDAIKQQQNKVESLKLDIRESDVNIKKLEGKLEKEVIYSKIDGTVYEIGDPVTGVAEGESFMTVKSKDGYYVKGTVSELLLDQIKEGTKLNCSGSNGMFEAEVIDISDYPVQATSYMGNGNPNVSYYTYSAAITDKSVEVSEADWLTVTMKNETGDSGVIVLDKAFVRSENGSYYVYKDENGVLKKQQLVTGGNVNGGYSILIKGGITREDKIAFPYGKTVREGVKTKDMTLEEMYGY